jgi:hypothetical protein
MRIIDSFKKLFQKKSTIKEEQTINVSQLDKLPVGTYVVLELNPGSIGQLANRIDSKSVNERVVRGLIKAHYVDDTNMLFYLEVVGIPEWGKQWEYPIYRHEIIKVRTAILP